MQLARELAPLLFLRRHQSRREAVQLFARLHHVAIARVGFALERLNAADAEERQASPKSVVSRVMAITSRRKLANTCGHRRFARIELARIHSADAIGELQQLLPAREKLRAQVIAALGVARIGVPGEHGLDQAEVNIHVALQFIHGGGFAWRGVLAILAQVRGDLLLGTLDLGAAAIGKISVGVQQVIAKVDAGAVEIGAQAVQQFVALQESAANLRARCLDAIQRTVGADRD